MEHECHDRLVCEATEAMGRVFRDQSVCPEAAANSLKVLQEEIGVMLDCLRLDGVDC